MRDIATELREDYPQLYPSSLPDDMIRLPEGWADIVRRLSRQLKAKPIVVDQVKEKWGGLRWYFTGNYDDEIRDAIAAAEYDCSVTCDACGSPGRLRTVPNPRGALRSGWLAIRCHEHAQGAQAMETRPVET